MQNIKFLLIILLSLIWFSCEKELNITDFEDEFGNYQPELKIEGLLQTDKPEDSVIRIIKTSTITDNDPYNGKDDDDDGFIDEYDEILPLVQDTSATVKVTNLNSGEEFAFYYVAAADSFISEQDEETHTHTVSHSHEGTEEHTHTYEHTHTLLEGNAMVSYGGYKPKSHDFQIEPYAQYQIEIYSEEFDKTITGVTTVYPAVEFIDTLYSFQDSIIFMNVTDDKEIFWKSDLDVTSYYLTYEELEQIKGDEWEFEYVDSYASSRDNDLTENYEDVSIGRGIIFGVSYETVLKLTVEALSPEYGRYIFSSLPLKDPQRSNLRDEDGNPVMGCFGAIAAESIYIVIEE